MFSGDAGRLRAALLRWYDCGRRPLPWRRTADPYRIWVAETMLQQTRVAVVIPAYRRFLRRFPNLVRLAHASEDEVLSAWSGLGYYRRARSLRQAAVLLVERGERALPADRTAAMALPGVGAYTAAAVLSIAYGQRHAAIDGNIRRVLSRLGRLPSSDARGEPLASLAERLLAPRRPGDWNQALMELGETVCTPASPRCERCPLRRWCEAHRHGDVHRYPRPKQRPARERLDVEMLMLHDRAGRLLLERGAFPYLRHLWLPPLEVSGGGSASAHSTGGARMAGELHHAILHRDLRVRVWERALSARALRRLAKDEDGAERRIFSSHELEGIGRSSLLDKALRCVDIEAGRLLLASPRADGEAGGNR